MEVVEVSAGSVDIDLAVEASGQWGMFTTAQAIRLGFTRTHLSHLASASRIHRTEARGVYKFAGVPDDITLSTLRAIWLALAPEEFAGDRLRRIADGGADAIVSRLAAAHYVYGLGTLEPDNLDFTVPATRPANIPRVRFHVHSATEFQVIHGLPVTSIAQTVADLYRDGIDNGHLGDIITDALFGATTPAGRIAAALETVANGNGRDAMLHALSVVGTPTSLVEANELLFSHDRPRDIAT